MSAHLHAARLAMLEGALLGLLRGTQDELDLDMIPTRIVVHVEVDPQHGPQIDLEFFRNGVPIAGETL